MCQCSGGRRCICAGVDFFLRKDEVREKGRKSKGERKDPRRHDKTPPSKSPYDSVARLSY